MYIKRNYTFKDIEAINSCRRQKGGSIDTGILKQCIHVDCTLHSTFGEIKRVKAGVGGGVIAVSIV